MTVEKELQWRERMIKILSVYFKEDKEWDHAKQKEMFYIEANAMIIPNPYDHLSFEYSNSMYTSSVFLVWQTDAGLFASDANHFNYCFQTFKDRNLIDKDLNFSLIKEKMLRALGTRSQNRDVVSAHNKGLCLVCFVYDLLNSKNASCISLPFIFPFPMFEIDKAILRKTPWKGDGL